MPSLNTRCATVVLSLAACALASAAPVLSRPVIKPSFGCTAPHYPDDALQQREEGVGEVAVLVKPDGTIGKVELLLASGNKDFDDSLRDAMTQCQFAPGLQDGQPVAMWYTMTWIWALTDDPGKRRLLQAHAKQAAAGSLDARVKLARLLWGNAKTEADKEKSRLVMRSAAERGHPVAQYVVGKDIEKSGGPADEAFEWYRKAAAQGNVLANERLSLPSLPTENIVPRLGPKRHQDW